MATGAEEAGEMLVKGVVAVVEPHQIKVVPTGPITPEDHTQLQTQFMPLVKNNGTHPKV